MKDESVHVILGWRCQTKDCGQFHFAKYLGEKSAVTEGFRATLKAGGRIFHIHCPKCRQTHSYDPKDLHSTEVSGAPPAGLRDLM